MHHSSRIRGPGFALLALLVASSCVDEKIVFEDRELFVEPAAEALGFLGYTDQEAKLTVCGNCHVDSQSGWVETAHADAWEGLQGSGHAQAFCEGCHTINELGNALTQPAGYNAVAEERYHDVQCESCHGPGLNHVQNPEDDSSKPYAPITVGTDLTTGCGECHSGAHHPFVEEWAQSPHGTPIAYPAGRDGCNACHEAKGALVAFGENADYIEKGSDELLGQVCVVCHDPHDATNEAQLRFPVDATNLETNLCAQCHNRRSVPDPNSSHGLHPHAPSAALLLGDAGWIPPGASIDQNRLVLTHGSENNERLCATCHVNPVEVTDPNSGDFLFQSVGHTFRPMPCLDEQGIPTGGDCDLTFEARSFEGCATGGCHNGDPEQAFEQVLDETRNLAFFVEELHDLLLQVDPNGEAEGGEIDARNPVFTLAEGCFFNMELAEFGGTNRENPLLAHASAAVHGGRLISELLRTCIQLVEEEYGVAASPDKAAPAYLKQLPFEVVTWKRGAED
jgi:predicted CXXCH cytochrome family protein